MEQNRKALATPLLPILRLVATVIGRYKWMLVSALLLLTLSLALDLIAPLLLKRLIDESLAGRALTALNAILGLFILIYVIKFLADLIGGGVKARFNEGVILEIRKRLYNHLQTLSMPFFNANRSGYLTSRLLNDTSMLGGLLGETFLGIITNVLLLAGAVVITFYLNWMLTVVLLLVVPLLALSTRWFGVRIRAATNDMQEQVSQLCGNVQENISGIALIQSYTMEQLASSRIAEDLDRLRRLNLRLADLTILSRTGTVLMTSVAGLSILWIGSREMAQGRLTIGDLMAFLAYAVNVYRPVQVLLGINISIQQSVAAAKRVFELMDAEPTVHDPEIAITLTKPLRGSVRYSGVSFAYEDRDVLSEISFDAEPGERVAIVGRSGAGKTTMLSLLPRFYEPKLGHIEVDGANIRRLSLKSLRSEIGIVSQETFMFAGTIRENLLCANPNVSQERMMQVIEMAQLADFIEGLPSGLDTHVGERGVRISGGERQRLSIARALLKNPPILILDEATSSVDSVSENLIKQTIERLLAGRTCFIIAHRFTTILDADRIVVLENGRIAGIGQHDVLYAENAVYARLYNEQFAVRSRAAAREGEEQFMMDSDDRQSRIIVRTDHTGFKQVKISRL